MAWRHQARRGRHKWEVSIIVVDKGLDQKDEEEQLSVSSGGDRGKVIDVVVVRVANKVKAEKESVEESQWCICEKTKTIKRKIEQLKSGARRLGAMVVDLQWGQDHIGEHCNHCCEADREQ